MAYREAAATLSFIVGPALGGLVLSATSLPSILFVEGLTSLLAGLLVALFLRESRRRPGEQQRAPARPAEAGAQDCPIEYGKPWVPIVTAMFVSCAYNFGQSFFDGFFPVLCAERFGLQATAIGTTQTAMAMVVFAVTAGLYGRAVRRLGLVETAALGLLLIAGGVGATGSFGQWSGVLFGVLLYAVGIPLFSPSVAAVLTRCAPAGRRGLVLGCDSAVNSVGRILAPVVLGAVYEISPAKAFGLVASVVAAGAVVMFAEKTALSRTPKP